MTIIPLIIVDSLGLSLFVLGIIEGFSEFFSSTLRLYSGYFFDKQENKFKLLLYPIYLALISKVVLLQPNTIMVILTKFIERLSNGSFAPIRDALILNSSIKEGKDLSLLNISKSAGCLLGPFITSFALAYKFDLNNLVSFCVLLCLVAIFFGLYLSKLPINLINIKTDQITLKLKDR